MSKYSFEFKKAYLNGESGKKYIAEKLCVPAPSNVQTRLTIIKNSKTKD